MNRWYRLKSCRHALAVILCVTIGRVGGLAAQTGVIEGPSLPVRMDSIAIFVDQTVEFAPDRQAPSDDRGMILEENGRIVLREIEWPPKTWASRLILHTRVSPIPKDETSVHDPWDRAGHIALSTAGHPDIELLKFITAYGGTTEYRVDISHLAPLFSGRSRIKAFIDTWLSPGWRVDTWLALEPRPAGDSLSTWALPIFMQSQFDSEVEAAGGIAARVNVPAGLKRVLLYLYTSGHCTDGRGADEFLSKDHVLRVDGRVVHRFRPWRDDCGQFRSINPYCRRWSDGSWSSDYARSGWCPGDLVLPLVLDVTDHLTPGLHDVQLQIEDVRPPDANGHKGYWRVSAYAAGYP